MTLSKIREEVNQWFQHNAKALMMCGIAEKQIIKYIYSALSKEQYVKQHKYILEQLDPTVQAYTRYQTQHDDETWVQLKRLSPNAPEHAILKEKKKDVRTIWKMK